MLFTREFFLVVYVTVEPWNKTIRNCCRSRNKVNQGATCFLVTGIKKSISSLELFLQGNGRKKIYVEKVLFVNYFKLIRCVWTLLKTNFHYHCNNRWQFRKNDRGNSLWILMTCRVGKDHSCSFDIFSLLCKMNDCHCDWII